MVREEGEGEEEVEKAQKARNGKERKGREAFLVRVISELKSGVIGDVQARHRTFN